MSKIVECTNIADGSIQKYIVPSVKEAVEYSKKTHGEQYDEVEGKIMKGGTPMLWPKIEEDNN